MNDTTLWVAFTAGFLSFLSPCVLPLIPSYIGFITGISFSDLTGLEDRGRVLRESMINSALFIFGFTIIFVLLGATATAVGTSLNRYQDVIRWVGGTLVIILGVHFTGLINIKFLQIEKRVHLKNRPVGYIGAILIGMAFAAGWTPCIGPILGSILMVAATQSEISKGMTLLAVYSLGFGIPFFLSAIALNKFLTTYKKISRHIPKIIVASGVILVIIGVLIITNNLSMIGLYLTDLFS